jgi:acyl-CoA thioester hydrolase
VKAIVTACAEASPQFYDLDPLNMVWHGNYPRFLELGRNAVMERIGYSYPEMAASGYAWPIIDLRMRYARPMRLGKAVRIIAGIVEWENTLRIAYQIEEAATGERVMRARSAQVAVEIATDAMLWATPPVLREKLAPFLSPS